MKNELNHIIDGIGRRYGHLVSEGARNYMEVDIGREAGKYGYDDLKVSFRNVCVIVPLKEPVPGMKVRIDGRGFSDYARLSSGLVTPGYVARAAGLSYQPYVPNDSMVCNFAGEVLD